MSAVQALAALLSADAQSRAQLGAASMAANASVGNSANALKGDMYRADMQGQIANRGIDADMQRFVGEQSLRSQIARRQLGLDASRNNLASQQLGLQREQFGTERDLKLAELGQGRYAPQIPAGPEDGAADTPEAMIKRMFMANPNNPRFAAMMSGLLGQDREQSRWREEFDFKKGALKDPNALFASLAPHVAGMEGVNPTNLGSVLAALKSQLGGPAAPAAATNGAAPTFTQATQQLQNAATDPLLQALGIDPKMSGEQVLDKVVPYDLGSYRFSQSPVLKDPAAMEQLRAFLKNRAAVDPNFAKPEQSFFGRDASQVGAIIQALMDGQDPAEASSRNRPSYSPPYRAPVMRLGF